MNLTADDRTVLAHVVVDPDAYVARAVGALGDDAGMRAVRDKVERWRPDYESALTAQGESYKTRADREADAAAADAARREADLAALAAAEAARAEAVAHRKAAAAVSLNNSVVRTSREQRDAFALLIGARALTIPLEKDATASDIEFL